MRTDVYRLILFLGFLGFTNLLHAQEFLREEIRTKSTLPSGTELNRHQHLESGIDLPVLRALPPSNDDCANAIPLTVGASCISGTTVGASIEAGENNTCNANPDQSVWYNFVATRADMYVAIDLTASSGCFLGSSRRQLRLLDFDRKSRSRCTFSPPGHAVGC